MANGNSHFATSTRQVPRFAENGEKGVEKNLILELKVLADVGLVGFPNVGKSTFLSQVSKARPKIADYHFTTLEPNLGVVNLPKLGKSFVMADIPGLIEGASEGAGLGHQFLRHIERTKLLLHVIDISGSEGRNPVEDFNKINDELRKYSEKLSKRKQIIVANKSDIGVSEKYTELEKIAKENGYSIYQISAATGDGIENLLTETYKELKEINDADIFEEEIIEKKIYELKEEQGFEVTKEDDCFIVTGKDVEKLLGRVNLSDNESMFYFTKMLKKIGIEDKLIEMGVKEGDTVKLLDYEFEWYS